MDIVIQIIYYIAQLVLDNLTFVEQAPVIVHQGLMLSNLMQTFLVIQTYPSYLVLLSSASLLQAIPGANIINYGLFHVNYDTQLIHE
jgi:hypothetical protein